MPIRDSSSPDSADEAANANPNSNSNSDASPPSDSAPAAPESESLSSIEALARRVQESLALSKRHRFWETQPVGQFKDLGDSSLPEGPIEPPTPLSEVKPEPYNLPTPYEWSTCDMDNDYTCGEVYTLLTANYVEDDENMFRFNYSQEFLRWALRPPGYVKAWHIGVRVKASKKLVAFITGVPARIRVKDDIIRMAEITSCASTRSCRSKRLAPVMIKEVTRRVHLENIWRSGVHSWGGAADACCDMSLLAPFAQPQEAHRRGILPAWCPHDHEPHHPAFTTLPELTVTPGFRKMEFRDVPAVTRLLRKYLSQFIVTPDFDEHDVEHWLLPLENVVDSYLVESPETHEVTDFCSFYTLPSSILNNQNYSVLKAAYSFYNVVTKTPLLQLMNDMLIMAKQKDYDVFNALDVMQNESFLKELKFGPGDGQLHYYLYNYRLWNALKPSELGLVLL